MTISQEGHAHQPKRQEKWGKKSGVGWSEYLKRYPRKFMEADQEVGGAYTKA